MSRLGRAWAPAVAALALVGSGACASIPTDSAVTSGGPALPDRPVRELVAGPAAGVLPADLVRGFLDAAPGAPDEYAVARSFLTPSRAGEWRPELTTVVYSDAVPAVEVAAGAAEGPLSARVTVTVTATVDGDGRYVPAPTGLVQSYDVTMVRFGGQWRIDELPDLVLVSEPDFGFQYRHYPLWFLDPAREVLVPESRWLPNTGATVTRLVSELLEGASPWLAGAVVSAVPAGTSLAPPRAVTTDSGTAVLELTGQARLASTQDRALMRAQLLATLQPVLGVRDVELRVDGGELDVRRDRPVPTAEEQPAGDPVLVDGASLLRLRGRELVPVERVASLAGLDPSDPGVSLDGTRYAVLTSQRSQLRVLEQGTAEVPEVLLTGSDLTAPSLDRHGWVWTTSALSDGSVTAVGPSGAPVRVDAPWLAGRRVGTLRVSRDGARVAVASRDAEGVGHVDVAGVVLAGDGAPTRLEPGPPRSVGTHLTVVQEAVWVGSGELAVLGAEKAGDQLRVQVVAVGGPRRQPRSELTGVTGIAGGQGPRSILATVEGGAVLEPSGTSWAPVLDGGLARDPAFPG